MAPRRYISLMQCDTCILHLARNWTPTTNGHVSSGVGISATSTRQYQHCLWRRIANGKPKTNASQIARLANRRREAQAASKKTAERKREQCDHAEPKKDIALKIERRRDSSKGSIRRRTAEPPQPQVRFSHRNDKRFRPVKRQVVVGPTRFGARSSRIQFECRMCRSAADTCDSSIAIASRISLHSLVERCTIFVELPDGNI